MTPQRQPADRAKVTLIDRRNPDAHVASLVWYDAAYHIDDFDLSILGEVRAVQDDLFASPPRGWVVLNGICPRRAGSSIKLLPKKLRLKRTTK
jgi:hypothetical protein